MKVNERRKQEGVFRKLALDFSNDIFVVQYVLISNTRYKSQLIGSCELLSVENSSFPLFWDLVNADFGISKQKVVQVTN